MKIKLMTQIVAIIFAGVCMEIISIILLLGFYTYETAYVCPISGADACTYFQTLLTLMWLIVDITTDKSDK